MSALVEAVAAAVIDYRSVYPEPWPLSPNLALAVEASNRLERAQAVLAHGEDIITHSAEISSDFPDAMAALRKALDGEP